MARSIKNKNLDGKSNAIEPWPFAIDANTAKKLNKIKTGELEFDSEEKNKNKKQLKHKFYPCTYRLELGEDGGNLYIGKVNRATYNFFKEQKIDIDAYASLDWDNKKVIPSKFQPFPSGSPDYCDNLISASGATMDNNNLVNVFNEKDDEIWKCSMDSNTLDDEGVIAEEMKEFYLSDLKEGTVVFYGVKGEKGTFFSGELKLSAPFNPKKLKLEYVDADGWLLCNSVLYDEKIIDNTNCSTILKYTQNKWIIVGGEKVYE